MASGGCPLWVWSPPYFVCHFPLRLLGGDEGNLLNGAEHILRGTSSTSIFQFLPPGSFLSHCGMVWRGGDVDVVARYWRSSRSWGSLVSTWPPTGVQGAPTCALIAIGWAVMSQGLWTQINHHWFTTLFSMVAAWAVLVNVEQPQRWLRGLIAGLASGAAW